MNLKTRARIAVEAGKQLFPELARQDTEVFSAAVKAIALMDKEDLQRLNERSVLLARSAHFINASSHDFYRLQELYQSKRDDMHDLYSDGSLHEMKKDYPEENLPKEDSDGKQVKDAPEWLGDVAEIVRNELESLLKGRPEHMENYPEKNIPKESSKEVEAASRYQKGQSQSENSFDIENPEVQKLIDDDQAEALSRAELESGASEAGDGQVLYDEKVHDKDPYGYSNYSPQAVEGDDRVASAEGGYPEEAQVVAESGMEDEDMMAPAMMDEDSGEMDMMDDGAAEEESMMDAYMENMRMGDEEAVMAGFDEDAQVSALFGEEESILEVQASNEGHQVAASLQKGRIPSPLLAPSSSKSKFSQSEADTMIALFGEDI